VSPRDIDKRFLSRTGRGHDNRKRQESLTFRNPKDLKEEKEAPELKTGNREIDQAGS